MAGRTGSAQSEGRCPAGRTGLRRGPQAPGTGPGLEFGRPVAMSTGIANRNGLPTAGSATMSDTPTRRVSIEVPPALRSLAVTGLLLERLDRLPRKASAAQYRSVVQRVQALLAQATPGPDLDRLLASMPGLAELWENRHYGSSGLCRAPIDAAVDAERETAALIERLRG